MNLILIPLKWLITCHLICWLEFKAFVIRCQKSDVIFVVWGEKKLEAAATQHLSSLFLFFPSMESWILGKVLPPLFLLLFLLPVQAFTSGSVGLAGATCYLHEQTWELGSFEAVDETP